MSFAPPSGPPPPSVPEGWKPQYDERYHAWFYVNLATGKSQWEKPETAAQRDDENLPPNSPPPSYNNDGPGDPAAIASAGDKKQNMGSNNPYNPVNTGPSSNSPSIDEDARLAAKLQAEEDARGGTRGARAPGASTDYYNDQSQPQSTGPSGYAPGPSSQSPMPEPEQKRSKGGFLSKLMGKSSSSRPQRPQQQYASYSQQPPQQSGYYGGYPQQQPGYGYPQQGYGGYAPQGGGGYYQQRPPRKQGGGMGTAGAAALGVGGGLLGGMLIADAIDDHQDYDNDYGGGGDDFGGGDFGGGDF